MIEISPERLAKFETATLLKGSHASSKAGQESCALEWAAYLANEPHSDSPGCVDPVIARAMIRLNDRLNDKDRQFLKPYVLKSLNTKGSNALSIKRGWVAADFAVRKFAPTWLELAGMSEEAALLRALNQLSAATVAEARALTQKIRSLAWDKRSASRTKLIDGVREAVKKALKDKPAAAYAAAAADAAAAAYAAAAADAAAAAYAAADAYADAAAYAYADAAANRSKIYTAVYDAVKKRLAEAMAPTLSRMLPNALEMLDAMIECTEA